MANLIARQYASATSPDAVERFFTSWLLSPAILFFWRALVALYAFIVLFIILGHNSAQVASHSFSYFTVLGYWGLAFYYAVAAVHTAIYWKRGRAWLQSWPSGLKWAHYCFYSSVTTFPFVVTVVFWTVLSYGALSSEFTTWANISEHGLNSLFALSEVVITRVNPSPWINLIVVIILLALYLALAEVTYHTEGWYVYEFLDPKWHGEGVVAGACIGILLGTAIVFVIVRYLVVLRKRLTEGKAGRHAQSATYPQHGIDRDEGVGLPMQVMPSKGAGRDMNSIDSTV